MAGHPITAQRIGDMKTKKLYSKLINKKPGIIIAFTYPLEQDISQVGKALYPIICSAPYTALVKMD